MDMKRYNELKREFERQLCRPLSMKEQNFIAWLVKREQQASVDNC